jgi:hypothetical protein
MASNSFLPAGDEELDVWSGNFSGLITAAPTTYGLVAADATALAALVTAYSTALEIALEPTTRTPVTVATKDTARAALVADIRSLARRIQANPAVTVAQKTALGLTIVDHVHSPTPPPATKPVASMVELDGRAHLIRLVDEATPTRRARPLGTAGAEVYSFVAQNGETPPGDLEQWRHEGLATRSEFTVNYEQADIGKLAHIRAQWINRKGQRGPVSDPITGTVAA